MVDKFLSNTPDEFMTFPEIVNDLTSKLSKEDRYFLQNSTKYEVRKESNFWYEHIRRFYLLWHPQNPLTHKANPKESPDDLAVRLVDSVWDYLHYSHYPTTYA